MDVNTTLDALMRNATVLPLKASWIERYILSPISFWCDVHAPPEEKDPLSAYDQHLMTEGLQHQTKVVDESYADAVHEVFFNEEDGFRRTLELMASGEPYVQNMPLLCRRVGLEGRPDVLVRVGDVASDLGTFSYSVIEIKSARNIQRAHILQAAAYNRMLGLVQGYEPTEFHIINRDGDTHTVQMANVTTDLDDVLDEMRQIVAGKAVAPHYSGGLAPWESYVNQLSVERKDVSLIPGIGGNKRHGFLDHGFATVEAVASADERSLTDVRGVGPTTARKVITSAKAIQCGMPVRRGPTPPVRHATTEVFLDFEGTDPRIGAAGLEVVNYLIGAFVRCPSESDAFVSFFASSFADEERMLMEFLKWASSLQDAVFYHWGTYEKTHLLKMADHYNIPERQINAVLGRLEDLYPITTKSFAFPAYGEGLKAIAKSLGFSWRQEDVDGLASVVLYLDYVRSGGTDHEARQKILDYNEDDCRATLHIFDWLMSQSEPDSTLVLDAAS